MKKVTKHNITKSFSKMANGRLMFLTLNFAKTVALVKNFVEVKFVSNVIVS